MNYPRTLVNFSLNWVAVIILAKLVMKIFHPLIVLHATTMVRAISSSIAHLTKMSVVSNALKVKQPMEITLNNVKVAIQIVQHV